jgi:hypothetical protein
MNLHETAAQAARVGHISFSGVRLQDTYSTMNYSFHRCKYVQMDGLEPHASLPPRHFRKEVNPVKSSLDTCPQISSTAATISQAYPASVSATAAEYRQSAPAGRRNLPAQLLEADTKQNRGVRISYW